jgi:hypothetical protein
MPRTWLAQTRLGPLTYFEVFDNMDGPKLFSCLSVTEQLYLVIWFGRERSADKFLGVQVSRARYDMVRSGGIPIALAFRQPESGTVLSFIDRASDVSIESLFVDQIDTSLLPDEDDFLSLQTETLPVRMKDLRLAQKAVDTRRETFEFHLDSRRWHREEAPMKGLGKILTSTQELLDALGQRIAGVATMRGSISPDILSATETAVVQLGGGSFGLEVASTGFANLLGHSLVGQAFTRLNQLLQIGGDAIPLREALLDIKPRAVSKFREFLTAIVENSIDIKTVYASPDPSYNSSSELSYANAAAALLIAEQVSKEATRPIIAQGSFDAIDIPRKSFAAVTGQQTYRGRILESALDEARILTLGAVYHFRILESLEVASSGEEKLKYELDIISNLPILPNSPV